MLLEITLNGKPVSVEIEAGDLLADVLRDKLGFIGTKIACGEGECGACTVLVDGAAVTSCIYPATKAHGRQVETIEGLSKDGELHPIQEAFAAHAAAQCGYCTPGFIMAAKALLDKNPHPTREEIKQGISGNLCRCTGYYQIVEAIEDSGNRGIGKSGNQDAIQIPDSLITDSLITVGKDVERLDIHQKVQGTRKYPQDFNLEGQLYAKVVWSAHPHAVVKRIDTSAAEALPGVVKVLTYKDVPVNEYGINIPDQPVLVAEGDKVRWVGDRIAIVVAESERIAAQARDLIVVDYEVLLTVDDPRQAMQPGAPLVHEGRESNVLKHIPIRRGDVEQGFAQADVIVEGTYTTHCVEHAYLQPDAALGYVDDQGRITIITSCQWPADDLHQIAHMLDLPEDQVREIVPAVGGAFGGREDMYIQHLAALCAFVVRRPVKIVFDREEVTQRTGKRHPFYLRHRTGATSDGHIVAAEVEVISDAGAYASTSIPVLNNAATFALGPYQIPHARVDAYTVHTNNAVTMAMRGFGTTQVPLGYEPQMDKLAEALGMDPVEIRLKNLLDVGDVAVTGNVMTAETGVKETLRQAALAAGWRQEGERWIEPDPSLALRPVLSASEGTGVGAASAPHKRRGIGVAVGCKNVGYSLGFDDKSTAVVELTLAESGEIGRALVKIAAVEVGQGVLTALAQIAAETLGVDVGKVRLALVDTANTPDAGSSSASRHVFISGNAVARACQAAKEKWRAILRAETGKTKIEAEYTFRGRSVRATTPFDPETGQCEPHISFTYATQVALVEVDLETGQTDILKFWSAVDAGTVVNPLTYFGQQAGGVHMGVGYALTENYIQQQGRPRTRRFSEYHIPTVLDMPREFESIAIESAPDPQGPFGATGMGETTTLPTAPAILSAIHDATGVWINDLPASPERVWRAIKKQKGERKSWTTVRF